MLGTVPYRGQVLNQLAAWWFDQIADIVPSHLIDVPDPNVTIGEKCTTLPVEVVVRGRLSGSTSTALWTRYAAGEREIYGLRFPDGMVKNEALPEPIITPTTKAEHGAHDEPITEIEIVERGLVGSELWNQVRTTALAVFERGCAIAAEAVWFSSTPSTSSASMGPTGSRSSTRSTPPTAPASGAPPPLRLGGAAGQEPENLDKEFVRLAYGRDGYRGQGDPPALKPGLAAAAAAIYQETFEALTGKALDPAPYPAAPRVVAALRSVAARESCCRFGSNARGVHRARMHTGSTESGGATSWVTIRSWA